MPVPTFYSDANGALTIDPHGLWTEAKTVSAGAEVIANRIDGIHNVWKNLHVGWVGETSDEADAFNEEWNAALTKMFGTEKDPRSGVLNQVAMGVMMAAFNYGITEDTVAKMFKDFFAALGSTGDPNATPDPNRNQDTGPIHEVTH